MPDSQAMQWQGVNHIALQTGDLDATIQFYRDMLDMEVMFTAPAGEMHGRHAGIRPGEVDLCISSRCNMRNNSRRPT